MSKNKIDEATNTITSSNKFLHELKRIVINIVTYLVLGFIVYENRALLIEQATRTVIHKEVIDEFDHLHIDPNEYEKMKRDINLLYSNYKVSKEGVKENKKGVHINSINIKKDSIRIDAAFKRTEILLEKINKL